MERLLLRFLKIMLLLFGGIFIYPNLKAQVVPVVDLKQFTSADLTSNPSNYVKIGTTIYFVATDEDHGRELWKTNGTEAGTVLVKDINLSGSSNPSHLFNFNGVLYFAANDGVNGIELWKSNGTEVGTVLVKDLNAGSGNGYPGSFAQIGSTLYFGGDDGSVVGLFKTDGTAAGTSLVKTTYSSGFVSPSQLTVVNGVIFFEAYTGEWELWKSDGTSAGTFMVKNINTSGSSYPDNLFAFNNVLYFAAEDGAFGRELWRSDGTAAGTYLVKDINTGSGGYGPSAFTILNGSLYFNASGRLFKTDGTNAGTVEIGYNFIYAFTEIININNVLYFQGADEELWKSDGTFAGSSRVKDINTTGDSAPSKFTNVNGTLYFSATDGTNGLELWKSDGTTAGTVMVKNINTIGDSNPTAFFADNGTLYFAAANDTKGVEIWKSDGTNAGTVMVKNINTTTPDPINFITVGNTLYFTFDDGVNGRELWKTNGTQAGTMMVKNIHPSGSSNPESLTSVNNVLYFVADNGTDGSELWKSDGTAVNTVMVKNINTTSGSSPFYLTNVNGTLFFQATDDTNGEELWKSDGTAAGTVLVKNINTAAVAGSYPNDLVNVNGTLFFSAAANGTDGYELWKSDGTNAGTVMVSNIHPTSSSYPENLTNVNGTLFFSADNGTNGKELWKSDGTTMGTVMIKDIRPFSSGSISTSFGANFETVNGVLYFVANDGGSGLELWKSDGTAAGTLLVKNINAGSTNSLPTYLTNVNGKLLFRATYSGFGAELWKSDGTDAGTSLVKDIAAGSASSNTNLYTAVNDLLYFTVNGTQVWQSDGTEAQTFMIEGSEAAQITDLTAFNNILFYHALSKIYKVKRTPLITWANPADITYGTALNVTQLNATAKINGTTVPGTFAYYLDEAKTINAMNAVLNVGANQKLYVVFTPTSSDYATAEKQVTITVNKVSQTINFDALAARRFDEGNFTLNATATSGLTVSFVSSDNSIAEVTGTTVTVKKTGTVNIIASQLGSEIYNAASAVMRTLTINKGNQTITFDALPTKVITAAPFTLTASATSGLDVSYVSSNLSVATVDGNTVTLVGIGTTTISATQTGNENYNAAAEVSQVLTVVETQPVISVNTSLAFDDVVVGKTKTAAIVISNTGDANLVISNIVYPNGYTGDKANGTVIPNGTLTVNVTFAPAEVKAYTGNIVLSTNAESATVNVPVSGTGIAITDTEPTLTAQTVVKPNPATDKMEIVSPLIKQGAVPVILDVTGKQVTHVTMVKTSSDSYEINVSGLTPAMYIIKLHQGKTMVTKRFTKL